MKKLYILIACVFAISSCATAYQSASEGFTGGFSETRLREDMYRVKFSGNGYTGAEKAADFTLLRCAELTKARGYQYFIIVESSQWTKKPSQTEPIRTYTTFGDGTATSTTYGGTTYLNEKPRSSNTILMINNQDAVDGIAYDADFLIRSLRGKYGLEIHKPAQTTAKIYQPTQVTVKKPSTNTYANYVGKFRNDKRHGQGILTYTNGNNYVGEFKDNAFNGRGIFTLASGTKYVGEFKDDKRHGQGAYTLASGAKYVGEWRDDKYHGHGTYTYGDGSVEAGIWEDGVFIKAFE